jgi:hypothetical protein
MLAIIIPLPLQIWETANRTLSPKIFWPKIDFHAPCHRNLVTENFLIFTLLVRIFTLLVTEPCHRKFFGLKYTTDHNLKLSKQLVRDGNQSGLFQSW